MKRAAVLLLAVAAATLVVGCASADHSWRGEFTARLEGAASVVERAREQVHPQMSPDEIFALSNSFGPPLFFKSQLIAKLEPPADCEEVQVKGKAAVAGDGNRIGGAFKNLTPELERDLPKLLEDALEKLERIEREAETCE